MLHYFSPECYNQTMKLAQTPVNIRDTFLGDNPIADVNTPTGFISAVLPNVYIITGVILLLYLIFGGFLIITGGADVETTKKGQQSITNAIIGFILVFASYWIIQIIEVITGLKILGN